MDDNCGEWLECMGVASGCGEQEVGVATGCACKEVYRPHTTYPYSSCICHYVFRSCSSTFLITFYVFKKIHAV